MSINKLLVLLFVFCLLISCSSEKSSSSVALDGDWFMSVSGGEEQVEWQEIESPEFYSSPEDRPPMFFKTTLPGKKFSDPAIFIANSYHSMQVFINDSLIYSFGDPDKNNIWTNKKWHMIDLPDNYMNKEIVFKINSQTKIIGLSKHVFIGSSDVIHEEMFRNDLPKLFSGLFLILIGFFSILFTLYIKKFREYWGLTFYIVLFGIWLFFIPNMAQNYLSDPVLLRYLDIPMIVFSAASFLWFFSKLFIDKYITSVRCLSLLHFATGIGLLLVDIFRIITIKELGKYYLLFLLVSNIYIVIIILMKKIKNDREAGIIIWGVIIFLTLASMEIVCFVLKTNMNIFGLNVSFVHIGALTLIIFWVLLYLLKYIDINKKYVKAHELFSKNILDLQNEERKRIAGELHDAAGHDFLVIRTLSQMGVNDPEKVDIKDILRQISETSEGAVNNIRSICRALYPPILQNLGLTKALRSLIHKSFEATDIKINHSIDEIDELLEKSDHIHIYRIVQEVINNIIKHSGAENVDFKVNILKNKLIIIVADDGKGISNEVMKNLSGITKGIGLSGIYERVQVLKGEIELTDKIPSGLVIKISLPVKEKSKR